MNNIWKQTPSVFMIMQTPSMKIKTVDVSCSTVNIILHFLSHNLQAYSGRLYSVIIMPTRKYVLVVVSSHLTELRIYWYPWASRQNKTKLPGVCSDFIILVYIIDSLQAKGLSNYVKMAMTLDHAAIPVAVYLHVVILHSQRTLHAAGTPLASGKQVTM